MRSPFYTTFYLLILFSGFIVKKNSNAKVADAEQGEDYISRNIEGEMADNRNADDIAVDPNSIDPDEFVSFAKTLIGTPYLYASTDPSKGFDCSGFIYYVSHHFGLKVPRSSVDFTNYGITIERNDSRPGDFILFTGTDSSSVIVGHMGIITSNEDGEIEFIHSTSGKAQGVTISSLAGYYEKRFVKVIRVLDV